MAKRYYNYGDYVKITSGKFKGMNGFVQQVMPTGLIGVSINSSENIFYRYIYFKASDLKPGRISIK